MLDVYSTVFAGLTVFALLTYRLRCLPHTPKGPQTTGLGALPTQNLGAAAEFAARDWNSPEAPGRGHHTRRGGPPEVLRGHCASWILVREAGGGFIGVEYFQFLVLLYERFLLDKGV